MTAERMTAAQLRVLQGRKGSPAPGNKFNAKKVEIDGFVFDSVHEGNRYCQLRLLARAGQIRDLKLQVPIMLEGQKGSVKTRKGRHMRLTVDFVYFDVALGCKVYEDAKGTPTRDYEVRRGVAQAMGYEIREV